MKTIKMLFLLSKGLGPHNPSPPWKISGLLSRRCPASFCQLSVTWLGSIIAPGVMAGAIFSHLTVLGIVVQGDKGLLFALALIVFVASAINLIIHRVEIPAIGRKLA